MNNCTRLYILVRHGQRADHLPHLYPQYIGHPDAILTPLGHQQAYETGIFLKDILPAFEQKQSKYFDKLIVETSPFVRTLATTARICEAINFKDHVGLNYRYSEWLAPHLYG